MQVVWIGMRPLNPALQRGLVQLAHGVQSTAHRANIVEGARRPHRTRHGRPVDHQRQGAQRLFEQLARKGIPPPKRSVPCAPRDPSPPHRRTG